MGNVLSNNDDKSINKMIVQRPAYTQTYKENITQRTIKATINITYWLQAYVIAATTYPNAWNKEANDNTIPLTVPLVSVWYGSIIQ